MSSTRCTRWASMRLPCISTPVQQAERNETRKILEAYAHVEGNEHGEGEVVYGVKGCHIHLETFVNLTFLAGRYS